jgi:hypothetical protein
VLVDAAPSRGGDDYIRLDLARDMRQMSVFSGSAVMHIYAS